MLIGLSAKNAILIVEFAKAEMEQGRPLVEAALGGARQRLRPILMTSFAFIFGLMPLWYALGAGAAARRLIGTVTIVGMAFASGFAIFLVPVLFVVVERLSHWWQRNAAGSSANQARPNSSRGSGTRARRRAGRLTYLLIPSPCPETVEERLTGKARVLGTAAARWRLGSVPSPTFSCGRG